MNKYLLFLGAWWFSLRRGLSDYKIVLAVSAHESAVWTSDLWRRANNGFGMRPPRIRANSMDFETSGNYAGYNSGWRSVKDFFLWLDYNEFDYKNKTLKDLVKFQKSKGYFGDTELNYYQGAKYHYENNLGLVKNFFFVIKLIFVPTFILVLWKRKQILNYLRVIIRR